MDGWIFSQCYHAVDSLLSVAYSVSDCTQQWAALITWCCINISQPLEKHLKYFSSYILYTSGLMCVLMFHVTQTDEAEGHWVAQLCGCKASSLSVSLSKNWDMPAAVSMCELLSVCVCYRQRTFVCPCGVWVFVCVWQGHSLVHCQQFSTSQVLSWCDTCWPRAKMGHSGDNPDGW